MTARDYLTLVRESWWVILAGLVLGVVVAAVITAFTPPVYASKAVFYVSTPAAPGDTSDSSYTGAQLSQERVASYSELLTGLRVAGDASAALGGTPSAGEIQGSISTESTEETVVLSMTVTADSPQEATRVATAVTDSFIRLVTGLETPRGDGPQTPRVVTEVILPPTFAPDAVSPRRALNLPIGALVGLAVGVGAAIVRRTLDSSIGDVDELEQIADAAVLGTVPNDPGTPEQPFALWEGRGSPDRLSWQRAEAYRHIRTNVDFAGVDTDHRVLVVTSTVAGEGKTTLSINLAAAIAATDRKVILVDADLRRPTALAPLGLDGTVGLTTVMTGEVTLDAAIQRWSAGGADVLGSGALPARPNELLASRKAATLLATLRERYDAVIIDTPPLLPVTDAANLAAHADGAVVVCRSGRTSRHELEQAVRVLRAGSIPIVGTVLSGVRLGSVRRTYYGPGGDPGVIKVGVRDGASGPATPDAGLVDARPTGTDASAPPPASPHLPPLPPFARSGPPPFSAEPIRRPRSGPPSPTPRGAGVRSPGGVGGVGVGVGPGSVDVVDPPAITAPVSAAAMRAGAPDRDTEVAEDPELAHDETDGRPDRAAQNGQDEGADQADAQADGDGDGDGPLPSTVLQDDRERLVEGGDDGAEGEDGEDAAGSGVVGAEQEREQGRAQ